MSFMFEDLDVYRKSMKFVIEVYQVNGYVRDRSIKDQFRRAALSIPLNIAEGQGRMHGKEKRQFYNTARGSLMECIPLLQVCWQIGYMNHEKYDFLYLMANEIGMMLTGLIKAVKVDS